MAVSMRLMVPRSGPSHIRKACSNGHDERGSLSICSSCRLMAVPMRPQHKHVRHMQQTADESAPKRKEDATPTFNKGSQRFG